MKEIMKEMVGGCCVCSDERGWPDNPLVYCDGNGCSVAVHQACYGIIAVPTGPWYCRKCESPETKSKVRCELCPSKLGALKRTDTGGWAHVVCALYIPEVRFGNVTSMEPIVLRLIPQERYNKTCYICQDLGKTHRANAGACMQCNKSGCKQQFHVTCAQSLGLLCEEAGNYLDNVKYCGYCQHHYSKLKKGGNVKTIPPYKPVSHDSRSDSSEREVDRPTAHAKRAPGRKSSHSSGGGGTSGKNTPNSSKSSTSASQPMDTSQDVEMTPRKHKGGDKNKKKPSPSRRGSVAEGGGGGGSKTVTPAPSPSPQNAQDTHTKGGRSTPINTAKIPLPPESPGKETAISPAAIAAIPIPPNTTATTVVQQSKPYESVITNTEPTDATKQTKKRKAVQGPHMPVDYATSPASGDGNNQGGNSAWDQQSSHGTQDTNLEVEKIIKKAKTEGDGSTGCGGNFTNLSPAPPPPPPLPAHSPASHTSLQSPRHLPSPKPGPSGINQAPIQRSPSQHQGAMDSGLSHSPHGRTWGGLNVSYELQDPSKPGVSGIAGPSKEALVGANMANMANLANMASMASITNMSNMANLTSMANLPNMGNLTSIGTLPSIANLQNMGNLGNMPNMGIPPAVRNKKRAALATSMANTPPPPPIQTATAQNLSSVRRGPQPTPPPIYHDGIKDSPPSSPGSERPLKPKLEHKLGVNCAAPHMLGNELNPDSGAAARLQEQLTAELAAHAAGVVNSSEAPIPPPLMNKAAPVRTSLYSHPIYGESWRSGAQSLDQLLERQWEQGSQFLMEQAQHFDIASLLSCLHQLRTENVRLEEHVGSLLQRRDHLLAVNARLAIPLADLNKQNLVSGPGDAVRCARDNGSNVRAPPVSGRPSDNVACDRHQLMMREMQQKPS